MILEALPNGTPSTAAFTALLFFAQVAVIVGVAHALGRVALWIGQPRVIGEMAAGILLGPTLLGWHAPGVEARLFPTESLGYLRALSQTGLVLFMLAVGSELDLAGMRRYGAAALSGAVASVVVPFGIGVALAAHLYVPYAPEGIAFWSFALFTGAAMSFSALPVLARILGERGLLRSELGSLAISCAAVADVIAWCALAAIVALVRSTAGRIPLAVTIAGALGWALVMIAVVRPLFAWWDRRRAAEPAHAADAVTAAVVLAFASALVTEWLGVHGLFGAFLAGTVVPRRGAVVERLRSTTEPLTALVLLPIFFALTGLQTNVGLLSGGAEWLDCALIVALAVAGKLVGTAAGARLAGRSWRSGLSLGVLMNTRGLMELLVLAVGLEVGAMSRSLYTMMVLMALVTTCMTPPLLAWIAPPVQSPDAEAGP